jgi:hypothetical protein
LNRHDPQLRLRRSVETTRAYVLERRCRRRPAVNAGMFERSDLHVQARDGYIHISLVHPNFLTRPWNIIRELKEGGADTWAEGGAMKFLDEIEYEEHWMQESRKRRRLGLLRDIAVDAFDPLSRMGNADGTDRTRISNVGTQSLI